MSELTGQEIVRQIEAHRAELAKLGVRRLEVFGSFARGEAGPESDIDLLVDYLPGRGRYRDYVDTVLLLSGLFSRKIDLVKTHLLREELAPSILGGPRLNAQV